jgi:ATP-dependent DNA helicase RecQ
MKLDAAMNTNLKFPFFRPGQLDALLPVMHGRDVFVRMATGAGKSLCMFLEPLAMSVLSLDIVISPLNALMDRQV